MEYKIFALMAVILMNTSTLAGMIIETEVPEGYEESHRENIEKYIKDNQDNKFFFPSHQKDMEPEYGNASSCHWETKVIKPYVLQKNETLYKYIVVQSKKFEQKIKVTRCLKTGNSCYEDFGLDQFGIQTNCTEKYEPVKLYVFVKDKIVERYLDVPTCCVCSVIKY